MNRAQALTVVASRVSGTKAEQLLQVLEIDAANTSFPIQYEDRYKDSSFEIRLLAGNHSVPTSMVAIHSQQSRFLYTSDTAFTPGIAEEARGYPTLIHEATFENSRAAEPGNEAHSSAYQAGLVAAAAEVERLFLCHICLHKYADPTAIAKEARSAFQGEIVVPEPFIWYSL